MKCQILFSGKNKKNNIILSSAENAQRVVKVNTFFILSFKIRFMFHSNQLYSIWLDKNLTLLFFTLLVPSKICSRQCSIFFLLFFFQRIIFTFHVNHLLKCQDFFSLKKKKKKIYIYCSWDNCFKGKKGYFQTGD